MPKEPPTPFHRVAKGQTKYLGAISPGVHAYAIVQPMSRVRAYQTSMLGPTASRGSPQEQLLVGHIHTTPEGKVTAIEGFNGFEGERFAETARTEMERAGLLPADAAVEPTKALRACPFTGFR